MNTSMEPKRLTLRQWFKAKMKAYELRRRWKKDPEFRKRVQTAVSAEAPEYIKQNVKHK